jgi:hypothetical protein
MTSLRFTTVAPDKVYLNSESPLYTIAGCLSRFITQILEQNHPATVSTMGDCFDLCPTNCHSKRQNRINSGLNGNHPRICYSAPLLKMLKRILSSGIRKKLAPMSITQGGGNTGTSLSNNSANLILPLALDWTR